MLDDLTLAKRFESLWSGCKPTEQSILTARLAKLAFANEAAKHIRKLKVNDPDPKYRDGAAAMKEQVLRLLERSVR